MMYASDDDRRHDRSRGRLSPPRPAATVGDAAERADEEDDVVAQRGEQVVYWIRQVRPRWVTGPPSVSRSPCSTARRTPAR